MRIAGAIIAILLTIIILVQAAAAGTVNALGESRDSGGSLGFLVAILFFVAAALMFGKVMKAALGVWIAAAVIAFIGATSTFTDLLFWGVVACVYALGIFWGLRRARRKPGEGELATTQEVPRTP